VKSIVLLTQEYPYGRGESFLKDELDVYALMGVEVIVFPFKQQGSIRQLPKGISLFNAHKNQLQLSVTDLLKILCSQWVWKEFFKKFNLLFYKTSRNSFYYFLKMAFVSLNVLKKMEKQRRLKPDTILYSYWLSGLTGGMILFNRDRPTPLVTISRAHGGDVYENRYQPAYLPFRNFIFSQIDLVATVSKDGCEYIRSLYPQYASKIHTHYLGTRDHGFSASSSTDQLFRLVSCAYVSPVKRLHLLVDSLKALSLQHPDQQLKWTHIGGGEQLHSLIDYAQHQFSGLLIETEFTGDLENSEVLEFYRDYPVDLFVSVSSSEGIPVSMMEAVSVGIPILATDVGGVKELLAKEMLISASATDQVIAASIYSAINNLSSMRDSTKIGDSWRLHFKAEINYKVFAKIMGC